MSKVFEPEWGNPSLRTIIEAEFPEPISLIPSTPGWWFLLIAVVGLLARLIWHRRQRYLRDQYRRDALAQLTVIKDQLSAGTREAVRELAPLLRATAFAAAGRDTFSGLQGEAYAAALAKLIPDQRHLPVDELQRLAYEPLERTAELDVSACIDAMEYWIQKHRGAYA